MGEGFFAFFELGDVGDDADKAFDYAGLVADGSDAAGDAYGMALGAAEAEFGVPLLSRNGGLFPGGSGFALIVGVDSSQPAVAFGVADVDAGQIGPAGIDVRAAAFGV